MVPLRDTTKSGTFPIVNTVFIAINIAVFIFEIWISYDQFLGGMYRFSLVPAIVTAELAGGVAFWAHIGGFAAGLILAQYFDRKNNNRQKSFNSYYKN